MGDVRLSAVSHQVSVAIRVWRRLARAGLKLLFFVLFSARLNRLLKTSVARRVPPAAAKAGTENKAFIAAVNRCTTQKQDQNRVFQQTVEAVPFPESWRNEPVTAAKNDIDASARRRQRPSAP